MRTSNKISTSFTCLSIGILLLVNDALGVIQCFECDSTADATCSEVMPEVHTLNMISCDHIQEPQYCVKMTGVFEGELGTKRFCSARDWGDFCEWVQRPGDERKYRACVYSCTGDGCNSAPHLATTPLASVLLPSVLMLAKYFW